MFTMGQEKNVEENQVVTGIFCIHSTPTYVLFDSGASNSFVSTSHVLKMGLESYVSIDSSVVVPSGEIFECTKLYEGVSFRMCNVNLPIDLIEFPLEEFDVIVGMDWLTKYKATIDCVEKMVSLRRSKGFRVSYRDYVERPKVKLIASVTLKRLIRKGCPLILCHVRDLEMETPQPREVPIVREFEYVFPEEIPGLPPRREVEFRVDLIPGTRLISKAPYRMALKEIEELKKKLEELLEKGYVRPSVSPWVLPYCL